LFCFPFLSIALFPFSVALANSTNFTPVYGVEMQCWRRNLHSQK
jgi:hypothetical protein